MPAVRLNDKMYNLLKSEAERADCSMTLILELALRQLFADGVKAGTARAVVEDSYATAIERLTRKPDSIIEPKEPDEVDEVIDTYVANNLDIDPLPKIPAPIPDPEPDPVPEHDPEPEKVHDDIADLLEGI